MICTASRLRYARPPLSWLLVDRPVLGHCEADRMCMGQQYFRSTLLWWSSQCWLLFLWKNCKKFWQSSCSAFAVIGSGSGLVCRRLLTTLQPDSRRSHSAKCQNARAHRRLQYYINKYSKIIYHCIGWLFGKNNKSLHYEWMNEWMNL